MSRVGWEDPKQDSLAGHFDYSKNLWFSEDFIKANRPDFPRGVNMTLESSGCQGGVLPRSILMISFQPEDDAGYGCGACSPVFLHQEARDFVKEVEANWNRILGLAKARNGRGDFSAE